MKIGIIGGTGPEGTGLGFRWAAAGHEVLIGSRKAEKGERVAVELLAERPDFAIKGMDNETAVSQCDVAVLSVPYDAQATTLETVKDKLAGKLLITVVAPTGEKKARVRRLPGGLSAAEEAQQQLGDDVRVVAAFQNIGAHNLKDLSYQLDCDVLVCGDKTDARAKVIELVESAGMRGFHAGSIANAAAVEAMTSVLIFVNKQYKCHAGIKLTGLPE